MRGNGLSLLKASQTFNVYLRVLPFSISNDTSFDVYAQHLKNIKHLSEVSNMLFELCLLQL